ncbi:hypothetical protein QWY90_08945 [Flavobacterium paronense]|uniref:DUF4136 domain-containing protein n=1 Tax=Flavobacterium paronense TaxID=1392775 RepID=A0ABV5GAI3_9FLAO|nr:hypothetical protein [Flavobacterium paronense]MDN3677444.1 hypothetical protein [Flavobacterium paronense]
MKNKLLFVFLFLSISTFSQTTESLKIATKNLYEANYLMDFETIVSFSYPNMVITLGKDVMLEKLEKYYENDEYRLREQLETLAFQYGTIKKLEGKSFCVITFRNPMRYFFETKLNTETASEKATWLKQINKTNEVTFEPKRNSFNVRRISTYIAIMDETTNNTWRFFNLDDANQLASFETIFGERVKKELGL